MKLKKFVEDHKEQILVGVILIGVVAVTAKTTKDLTIKSIKAKDAGKCILKWRDTGTRFTMEEVNKLISNEVFGKTILRHHTRCE